MYGLTLKAIQARREIDTAKLVRTPRRDWSRLPIKQVDTGVSDESGTALPVFILGFNNADDPNTPRWVV